MKHWFSNLKFRYKLLLCITAITTVALFSISQLSYSYFYQKNKKEVLSKADDSVQLAVSTLSGQFNSLAVNINHLLVKPPFPQMIVDISHGEFNGYATYFSEGSQQINLFLQNQDMVSNTLFCGENNFLFSQSILGTSKNLDDLFSENIWDMNQITVLPTRHNTLSNQSNTIPILYPISYRLGDKTFSFEDPSENKEKARFIVLLTTADVNAYFERMSNSYTNVMYLADTNGLPLDQSDSDIPYIFSSEIKDWVSKVSNISTDTIETNNDTLYLTAKPIKFCDLKVVHITSQSALWGDIQELRDFFLLLWFACTFIAGILAIILSHLLTKPIKQLGHIIGLINDNQYEIRVMFSHKDEISQLGIQLNQMYDTIQLQLEQIKDEEQKKARAEIQMMSEQMNPHFLYNTLECIHFQILNANETIAGAMLESLGRYLRITLSMGNAMITIERELEHVTSYMEIMNRHSPSGIRFVCHIDHGLKTHLVLKSLLQPLVENSIKHGFGSHIIETAPVPPQITIQISCLNASFFQMEVCDNGIGIDIEKATESMMAEPTEHHHFGLNNIYKRLNACYGDNASVSFHSIPYFKNRVLLTIPLEHI